MEQQEPTDNASTSFFDSWGDASHSSSIEEYHSTNSELDAEGTNNSLTKKKNRSILERKHPLTRLCKERCPRAFRIFFSILLPHFLILSIGILCGYLITVFESPNEISTNNDIAIIAHYIEIVSNNTIFTTRTNYETCAEKYDDLAVSQSEHIGIKSFFDNCTDYDAILVSKWYKETSLNPTLNTMTFNWFECLDKNYFIQAEYFYKNWKKSYNIIREKYMKQEGMMNKNAEKIKIINATTKKISLDTYDVKIQKQISTENIMIKEKYADLLATNEATGDSGCENNILGGSIFWFSVMTTIGYGNAVPKTNSGRGLVFSLGFVSIICFAAIIGHSSKIMLERIDDKLSRYKRLIFLTEGLPAVFLWLAMFWSWIGAYALCYLYVENRDDGAHNDFGEALWFSYISMTTIGFGDYFLNYYNNYYSRFFLWTLTMLIGFLILGNFALKLSLYVEKIKARLVVSLI